MPTRLAFSDDHKLIVHHHNLIFLFRSSLDLRSTSHRASWWGPQIRTYDRVQFGRGALHCRCMMNLGTKQC